MQEIIESIQTNNPGILAKKIMERVMLFTGGKAKDDMTDSLPDAQHGSHSIHHRLLADVPRLLIRRLCHGPQKIRDKRLGMVCCFRYSCRHLLAHHLVATGSRRPLRRVHDFVCIPDYRLLPYHAVIRAEKPAQARERVEGKERSISRISSPHEACQKESHL